jgi:hypothetical protein
MLSAGETYEGYFDNIHFDAPDQPRPREPVLATYTSSNDSLIIERVWPEPGGFIAFSWSGVAAVQSATHPAGPWTHVTQATNQFKARVTAMGGFYRLHR